jgi:addiction module RelB/DinJ family antitoxin
MAGGGASEGSSEERKRALDLMTILDSFGHMAKTAYLRTHIPAARFKRAEKILSRFGLNPGEAVNVFFAKIEAEGGFPFELRSSETKELLSDRGFLAHLKRMQAGEVRYTDAKDVPA